MAEPRPCSIDDCDCLTGIPGTARGYCSGHYQRWRTYGDPLACHTPTNGGPCSIEDCGGVATAKGWCTKHYTRWRRYGSPTARAPGEVIDGKRICCGCGEDRPWTTEFFYANNSKPNGLDIECRSCARARRRLQPYRPIPRTLHMCDMCLRIFAGDARRHRFCSPECSKAGQLRDGRIHTLRRRALLANRYVEDVDPSTVYERDGFRCGICCGAIDIDIPHPDPMSPSVDHVVPLSRGGEHSYANCQASHLGCNCSKGDRHEEVTAA